MEHKVIIWAAIIIAAGLSSCKSTQKQEPISSRLQMQHRLKGWDTTYLIGANVQIKTAFEDSNTCIITWGNGTYTNRAKTKFRLGEFEHLPIAGTSENYILLSQTCGTACRQITLLPLKKGATDTTFLFVKTWDVSQGLIVYASSAGEELFIRITILDYEAGRQRELLITHPCHAVDKQECILRCTVLHRKLTINYYDSTAQERQSVFDIDSLFKN